MSLSIQLSSVQTLSAVQRWFAFILRDINRRFDIVICPCMSSHVLHHSIICSLSNHNPVDQFGNTCYCNSVLQALYFCRPFREKVLAYKIQPRRKESLLTCLADLFNSIATQKKKVGVIPPKKFISRLRKENGEEKNHGSYSKGFDWLTDNTGVVDVG